MFIIMSPKKSLTAILMELKLDWIILWFSPIPLAQERVFYPLFWHEGYKGERVPVSVLTCQTICGSI